MPSYNPVAEIVPRATASEALKTVAAGAQPQELLELQMQMLEDYESVNDEENDLEDDEEEEFETLVLAT